MAQPNNVRTRQLSGLLVMWCETVKQCRVLNLWNSLLNRAKLCELFKTKKDILPALITFSMETKDNVLMASVLETCVVFCQMLNVLSTFTMKAFDLVDVFPGVLFYANDGNKIDQSSLIDVEKSCCDLKLWKRFMDKFSSCNNQEMKSTCVEWCLFKMLHLGNIRHSLNSLPDLHVKKVLLSGDASVADVLQKTADHENKTLALLTKCLPCVPDVVNVDLQKGLPQ